MKGCPVFLQDADSCPVLPPDDPPPDDQEQNETPQPQEEPESEPQPEERLTREDAERLLNAVQSDELEVLEELRPEQPRPGASPHDW